MNSLDWTAYQQFAELVCLESVRPSASARFRKEGFRNAMKYFRRKKLAQSLLPKRIMH